MLFEAYNVDSLRGHDVGCCKSGHPKRSYAPLNAHMHKNFSQLHEFSSKRTSMMVPSPIRRFLSSLSIFVRFMAALSRASCRSASVLCTHIQICSQKEPTHQAHSCLIHLQLSDTAAHCHVLIVLKVTRKHTLEQGASDRQSCQVLNYKAIKLSVGLL